MLAADRCFITLYNLTINSEVKINYRAGDTFYEKAGLLDFSLVPNGKQEKAVNVKSHAAGLTRGQQI